LVGWSYRPALVEEALVVFEDQYDEQVDFQPVTGNYAPTIETKLIGGEHMDIIYMHPAQIDRWVKAGWVRDIEDMSGVKEIKEAMYPANVEGLSNSDGKLVSLPYYTGYRAFLYDEEKLGQAGFNPPETWDEFIDQCREIQGKGISKHPFIPYWIATEYSSWSWWSMWYSEGEPVFDDNLDPAFTDGGVAFQSVLEMMKLMFDEEIVPPDVLTMKDHTGTFGTGEHVFMHHSNYIQQAVNDPERSKIAGQVRNALIPGTERETFAWTAGYAMSTTAPEDRAWNLHRFMGYQDKEGEYLVSKKWALEAGLGSPYKEVMDDPEIVASFSQWTDLEIWNAQQEKSRGRAVDQAFWFAEWNLFMIGQVHDYLLGNIDIEETLATLSDKVYELKEKYPS
jgi:multiple sugar transport system substrate-binding protein